MQSNFSGGSQSLKVEKSRDKPTVVKLVQGRWFYQESHGDIGSQTLWTWDEQTGEYVETQSQVANRLMGVSTWFYPDGFTRSEGWSNTPGEVYLVTTNQSNGPDYSFPNGYTLVDGEDGPEGEGAITYFYKTDLDDPEVPDYWVQVTWAIQTKQVLSVGGKKLGKKLIELWGRAHDLPQNDEVNPTDIDLGLGSGPLDTNHVTYVVANAGDKLPLNVSTPSASWSSARAQNESTLEIYRGASKITDKTVKVVVGEGLDLKCVLDGGGSTIITNFSWTVPSYAVTNFYVSPDDKHTNGYPVLLSVTTNQGIFFWWADSGSKQVQCSVQVAGQTLKAQAAFNVVRPTGPVIASNGPVSINNDYQPDSIFALHTGSHSNMIHGILFSNTAVNMPPGNDYNDGNTNYNTQWVQVIDSALRRYQTNDAGGTWYRLQASGVLDEKYNYYEDALNVNPAGDSPGEPLVNSSATLYKTVSTSDTFKMYLMFQPSGGGWVTLTKVTWEWGGTATWSGTNWNLTSPINHVISNEDSTEYPQWTDNIKNHETLIKE